MLLTMLSPLAMVISILLSSGDFYLWTISMDIFHPVPLFRQENNPGSSAKYTVLPEFADENFIICPPGKFRLPALVHRSSSGKLYSFS